MASTTDDQSAPVAIVTGAGRRIGNVIARRLAAGGLRVALHSHTSLAAAQRSADELSQSSSECIAVSCDLRDEAATRAMIRHVQQHFGRIDALVNSAAIWKPKPLELITADDVRQQFEINALATFVCCQEAGLIMAGQPTGGAIVNIGDWAIVRPYLNYLAYFASKGAIPTMTRAFAVELARRNPRVRVNAILPGPVLLPLDLPPADRQAAIEATLARREGTPENVAHAVVFLLENDFVTGVCLPVDGGRSIFSGAFEIGHSEALG